MIRLQFQYNFYITPIFFNQSLNMRDVPVEKQKVVKVIHKLCKKLYNNHFIRCITSLFHV
jgi:hypothetical protein